MPQGLHTISIIPARGGSKRLPGKNLLPLQGRSLLAWSITQSMATPGILRHIVSTDDAAIAEEARANGAEVIERPAELATDTAGTLGVCQQVVKEVEKEGKRVDVIVLLQPTSPFRKQRDIEDALKKLQENEASAVIGVSHAKLGPKWLLQETESGLQFAFANTFDSIRTQDQPALYQPNGYLYIYRRDTLMTAEGYAWGEKALPHLVEAPFDLDIDTENDYLIAKAIANGYPYDWHA